MENTQLNLLLQACRYALLYIPLAICAYAVYVGKFYQSSWLNGSLLLFSAIFLLISGLLYKYYKRHLTLNIIAVIMLIYSALAGIGAVATVLLITLGCICLGDYVVKSRERLVDFTTLQTLLLNFLFGLVIYIAVLSISAHFPINFRAVLILLVFIPIFINYRILVFYFQQLLATDQTNTSINLKTYAVIMLLVWVMLLATISVFTPISDYDDLGYHLMYVTQLTYQAKVNFDYHNTLYALMPFGADIIYALAGVIQNEMAMKLLNVIYFATLCGLLYSLFRTRVNIFWATLLTALFAASPLHLLMNGTLHVELLQAVLYLGCFTLLVNTQINRTKLFFIALLLGGSLAVKLTAPFAMIPIILLSLFFYYRDQGYKQLFSTLLICGVIIILIGSSAYIYAYYKTGNPIFPYLNAIFQSNDYAKANFNDARWLGHMSWDVLYQMTIHSNVFLEANKGGAFGIQFLALLPLGLLGVIRTKERLGIAATLITLFFFFITFKFEQYLRYLYPILPIASIILLYGLIEIFKLSKGVVVATTLLIVLTIINVFLFPTAYWQYHHFPLKVPLSARNQENFIIQYAPERPLVDVANTIYGKKAVVVFLEQPFGSQIRGTAFYNNWYSYEFENIFKAAKSQNDIKEIVKRYGINLFMGFDLEHAPANALVYEYLKNNATVIATQRDLALYQVKN